MSKRDREPDSVMVLDIDGKEIDVGIYLDSDFRSLRYELTSLVEIEPMEAAFVLLGIVKSICEDSGVHPDTLLAGMASNDNDLH